MKKQLLFLEILAIILLLGLAACSQTNEGSVSPPSEQEKAVKTEASDLSSLGPEDVVKAYYQARANKDYRTAYALISDGFKEIDPTAETYEKFQAEMSHSFSSINITNPVEIGPFSIEKDRAIVSYRLNFEHENGGPFRYSHKLMKAQSGWKILNPYGKYYDLGLPEWCSPDVSEQLRCQDFKITDKSIHILIKNQNVVRTIIVTGISLQSDALATGYCANKSLSANVELGGSIEVAIDGCVYTETGKDRDKYLISITYHSIDSTYLHTLEGVMLAKKKS